jgi:hypothetical protein
MPPHAFEDALPVRSFRFEKGLRSFAGWWYFATTGAHVGFESWLERDHLTLMDFDPAVRAVSSQPFWLRWRDGEDRVRRHAPDFFARRQDGTGVVVDVRPDDRIPDRDAEMFGRSAMTPTTSPASTSAARAGGSPCSGSTWSAPRSRSASSPGTTPAAAWAGTPPRSRSPTRSRRCCARRANAGPEDQEKPKMSKRDRRVAARTKAAATPGKPGPPEPGDPEPAEEDAPLAKVIPMPIFDPFAEADKPW